MHLERKACFLPCPTVAVFGFLGASDDQNDCVMAAVVAVEVQVTPPAFSKERFHMVLILIAHFRFHTAVLPHLVKKPRRDWRGKEGGNEGFLKPSQG